MQEPINMAASSRRCVGCGRTAEFLFHVLSIKMLNIDWKSPIEQIEVSFSQSSLKPQQEPVAFGVPQKRFVLSRLDVGEGGLEI
jgi:hypothetical protein